MSSIDARVYAMFAVSSAVASGERGGSALDEIAAQACCIVPANAASILELTGQQRFRIVGSHGLSANYRTTLHDWPSQLSPGHGPSGLAVSEGRPVIVSDFQNDPRFTEWSSMPMREAWRSLAALPLVIDKNILGTLVLYRTESRPWTGEEIELLGFVAEHGAVAVRTAQLIAEQQRQVMALERLVRGLREQAHEHANRLHSIAGLLILDEPEEALSFIQQLTSAHLSDRVALSEEWPHSALAALVRVEVLLARHRSIDLRIDLPPTLAPTALSDAQAVTIVGNLLDNALEAVAEMPSHRRRVDMTIAQDERAMTLRVRDRGPGIDPDVDPFERGRSNKPEHAGLGLSLVRDAVIAAYGEVRIENLPDGTVVEVVIPLLDAPRPDAGEPDGEAHARLQVLKGVGALTRGPER